MFKEMKDAPISLHLRRLFGIFLDTVGWAMPTNILIITADFFPWYYRRGELVYSPKKRKNSMAGRWKLVAGSWKLATESLEIDEGRFDREEDDSDKWD